MNLLKISILFLLILSVLGCDEPSKVDIVGWGDSMMKGSGGDTSVLEVLAKDLNITHKNLAVGGLNSSSIGVLQGGIPMKVVLENNLILKGEPTKLSYYNIEPLNFQTKPYRKGFLGSIEGKLERLSEKENDKKTIGYTFRAKGIDHPIKTKDTVTFIFEDALAYRDKWTIIWAGRNDVKSANQIFETRDNIQAMIDHLGENAQEHLLILSICNGIADTEYKGSKPYVEINRLNALLKEAFGNHFIDIRAYMVQDAIYDMEITPSQQDLEDMKKDCIPRSLLNDNVHFNTFGYEAAGKYVAQVIKEKGWIIQ